MSPFVRQPCQPCQTTTAILYDYIVWSLALQAQDCPSIFKAISAGHPRLSGPHVFAYTLDPVA